MTNARSIWTTPALSASGLTGATSGARFVGATASGSPGSGTFVKGDFVVDQTGILWICTTGGSPGTWASISGGAATVPTSVGSGTKTPAFGTVTLTIATPAVFSFTSHGFVAGDKVTFTTTGALPTGLTVGTTYFVIAAGLTANNFEVSTTDGGSAVATTGSQSGTHTMTPEHILLDISTAGTYRLELDKAAMAAGDLIELRVYNMVLTGGTRRPVFFQRYADAAPTDDMIAISAEEPNDLTDAGALRFTLRQAAGVARAFPWKVLSV